MEHGADQKRSRLLVTVVGPYSEDRVELARALIERGVGITLCAGPPSCGALRGDSCPLLETSDMTVVLPVASEDRRVIAGLSLCVEQSRACFVMEPTVVPDAAQGAHVRFSDAERAADFVAAALRHPSAR